MLLEFTHFLLDKVKNDKNYRIGNFRLENPLQCTFWK